MGWPQITLIVLMMMNQMTLAFLVGLGTKTPSKVYASWFELAVVNGLLWAGGFYSGGDA